MDLEDKYDKIINFMCEYKKITKSELFKILNDRECKYILFLLLKKYKCTDIDTINTYFPKYNRRSLNYGLKKAKEKFLINKSFREQYFDVEDCIEKNL